MGIYREIISVKLLEPFKNDFRYHDELISYLKVYSDYNLRLILTMGNPTPAWAAKLSWCILPEDDSPTEFDKITENLTDVFSNFLQSLWNSSSSGENNKEKNEKKYTISRDWIKSRLYIEFFNEIDTLWYWYYD